eukprot:gnl/Spiro4/15985_TR8597_c0_g1_i1.p1 gnl/Spiro4/15985_TR8597_c0_g1~~gnl/Spiro4/15985_TR8597_c0_g1_i1.p1  ORF type:complete len:266 (-),score=13.37 gnl/Spiro4/15985_TR8597_c0_g1_i1:21-791(-)
MFAGKVALVTGGTSGIGFSIAEGFAQHGAHVAITSRCLGRANESAEKIRSGLNEQGKVLGVLCDVRIRSEIQSAVDLVEESLGPIDILVNSAGVRHDQLLMRASERDTADVIATNLTAPLYTWQAVWRSMSRRRSGTVINIGSVVGIRGNRGQGVYAAAKSGLIGLTKTQALEGGLRGIRVNLIVPGMIETAMTEDISPEQLNAARNASCLKRLGSPKEVASAAVFLASPGASFITGVTLEVDGGLSCGFFSPQPE